jgi:hypothetical protein
MLALQKAIFNPTQQPEIFFKHPSGGRLYVKIVDNK